MAQSVELLLDPVAEIAVGQDWAALTATGLPSETRTPPDGQHRPHITLFAGPALPEDAEGALSPLIRDLDLVVQIGSLQVFGPTRDRYVLVRQIVPSIELLALQRQVADLCQAEPSGHFGAGRWSPHVTLARRLTAEQAAAALRVLARSPAAGISSRVTTCRRWDGAARQGWLL